ncbi:hypothetical protein [Sphingobium yanoikuyae]|uniref:hypothetical protein n=1 Tax=Sphingobium yanoikuyae TaxID=13690 RepID=UPI0026F12215|nr:hypothetical protein [Sphingobium yanoikuyae]
MTIVTRRSVSNPESAGLPALELPTASEVALLENGNVLRWWRASQGYNADGWACWKTGAELIIERDAMPARQTLAAYNNKPALVFSAATQLYGAGLFPTDTPYSLVVVGRAGPNDNAFLAGATKVGNTNKSMVWHTGATGDGRVGFTHEYADNSGPQSLIATSANRFFTDGPMCIIGSHDASNVNKLGLRIDGGSVFNGLSSPGGTSTPNTSPDLHVGGVNATGSAIGGGMDGGDIAEILVLNTALHLNTALRDTVEAMVNERYALW